MEGVLWKWTNYWNGWQTRWFVLDDGILSYYMSQDEVKQGCKGSLKVSAIEIIVSNVDNTRMDLAIPGEKHIYLKAATPHERQQWLVALGSSKACLTSSSTNLIPRRGDMLKNRRAELKLYSDLLMQQVHSMKEAARERDVQKLEESSSLLEGTCDTFIKTLEDCIAICNDKPTRSVSAEIMTTRNSQPLRAKVRKDVRAVFVAGLKSYPFFRYK